MPQLIAPSACIKKKNRTQTPTTKRKSSNVKVQEIRKVKIIRTNVEVQLLSIQQEFLCGVKTKPRPLQSLIEKDYDNFSQSLL